MSDARIAKIRELQRLNEDLQAQVAVLRGAIISAMSYISHYGAQEPAMKEDIVAKADILTEIDKTLSTTPAEAAERVNALVGALETIKRTGTGTLDGVMVLTQEAKLARKALSEWTGEKSERAKV